MQENNSEIRRKENQKFLEENIFVGLINLNDGFDTETIKYFSESDFETVLKRVEKFNIGIFGIEPWLNKEFYDVLGFEDFGGNPFDPNWYRKAFLEFKKINKNLVYSASYTFRDN